MACAKLIKMFSLAGGGLKTFLMNTNIDITIDYLNICFGCFRSFVDKLSLSVSFLQMAERLSLV